MWRRSALTALFASCLMLGGAREIWADGAGNKLYVIHEGKVDARTYNGYRRYHAGCNH
jgi:hypothetical protein